MSQEQVEMVRRLYALLDRGDDEAVRARLHPDFAADFSRRLLDPVVLRGLDEMRAWGDRERDMWEDGRIVWEPEELIDAGDKVLALVRTGGRGKLSGAQVDAHVWNVWTFRDGRPVEWRYFGDDRAAAFEAAGLGSPTERRTYAPGMNSSRELEGQVALVTGGGRGIGRLIAKELSDAGMRVAVAARSSGQAEETAREIGGLAVTADVSKKDDVEAMVSTVERELGPIDLLVNNAGVMGSWALPWEEDPADWWRVFEINVLGAYLCSRTVLGGMVQRGRGRIVNTGSGAAYLPGGGGPSAYGASKAALGRFGELLARQVAELGIAVFVISPGLVRTEMTEPFGDDAPWTPPELAPRLVRVLASGRADRLAGRYIHAEHDDIEALIERADEIEQRDLNAIRLQR